MSRTSRAHTSRVKAFGFVVAAGLGAIPAGAAAQDTPPSRIGPIWDGQRHQPGRGMVQERLQEQGAAPDPARSEQQLRELNDLSRKLLPPGSPVPAPGVEGQAPAGR